MPAARSDWRPDSPVTKHGPFEITLMIHLMEVGAGVGIDVGRLTDLIMEVSRDIKAVGCHPLMCSLKSALLCQPMWIAQWPGTDGFQPNGLTGTDTADGLRAHANIYVTVELDRPCYDSE